MNSSHQQQPSVVSHRPIWFVLLNSADGRPYKGTTASKVSVSSSADVDDFRIAVYVMNSSILTGIAPSQLLVYKNKASFDKRSAMVKLEEDVLVADLGKSKKEALVVVVPSSSISSSRSKSGRTGKEPNPKRKQRWIELNGVLERYTKKSKTNDSSGYIEWHHVKSVFNLTKYVQSRRSIDNVQLDFLARYLSYTTKCFGDITTGKDAKRLHFIAPILICVCSLFNGDVDIVAEDELVGNFVNAHGHFEFMLRRGNKAICIVEAKKDDLEQGMAQDLVACEVAAEVGGLDVVYGIVTNYVPWNFLRSLNEKIELEECSLRLAHDGPERESLKEIAEKIYAMLSND